MSSLYIEQALRVGVDASNCTLATEFATELDVAVVVLAIGLSGR